MLLNDFVEQTDSLCEGYELVMPNGKPVTRFTVSDGKIYLSDITMLIEARIWTETGVVVDGLPFEVEIYDDECSEIEYFATAEEAKGRVMEIETLKAIAWEQIEPQSLGLAKS